MGDYLIYVPIILVVLMFIWLFWCSCEHFEKSKKRQLKFIHIPKTGGTAMVLWGIANKQSWGRKDPNRPKSCETGDASWHCPADYWDDTVDYFCMVRDPVDRMISEANYENIKRRKANKPELQPDQVNEWLSEMILNNHDNIRKTAHFIPQWKYVYRSDGKQLCKNIIKYSDDTGEMYNKLTKLFKLYDIIPKDSKDIYIDKAMVGDNKLTKKDLSPQVISLIKNVYKKDYDLLT